MKKKSYFTFTDQFCGAGGSSKGAEEAGGEILMALNHWMRALETYVANHPKAKWDCTDVSAVDPRRYPSTDGLITSPECTNHSLAKGVSRHFYEKDLFGNILIDPANERSRATMWDVPRFAEYHDYNIIVTENVVDAGKWRMFDAWLHAMHSLDYEHEVVYLNSMFCWPTPQSRDRMYVIFWKRGNKKPDLEIRPKAYCHRCGHDVEAMQFWKKSMKWGRYEKQYFYVCPMHPPQNIRPSQSKPEWQAEWAITPYYYAAFNAIDWSIASTKIGDRKKPLEPKTLERIRFGLDTFGRQVQIITNRYTSGIGSRVHDANIEPLPTQPGDASHSVMMPWLIDTAHSSGNGKYVSDWSDPMPTQTTAQTLAVVSGFLSKQYGHDGRPSKGLHVGMHEALGAITTYDHHALLSTDAFLSYYYGTTQTSMITDPLNTIVGKEKHALVQNASKLSIQDLYFRMLRSNEVGRGMAFQDDYIVLGTEKERVKQYGNAVTPPAMKLLIKRCMATFQ